VHRLDALDAFFMQWCPQFNGQPAAAFLPTGSGDNACSRSSWWCLEQRSETVCECASGKGLDLCRLLPHPCIVLMSCSCSWRVAFLAAAGRRLVQHHWHTLWLLNLSCAENA
jgi:hypothetical protein